MLVFTRKVGQAIVIGDGIEVQVLRATGDSIRLGVTAPSTVPVHRREIYDQICAQNRSAAKAVAALDTLAARLRSRAGVAPDAG